MTTILTAFNSPSIGCKLIVIVLHPDTTWLLPFLNPNFGASSICHLFYFSSSFHMIKAVASLGATTCVV